MIELDACKTLWRNPPASSPVQPMRREELMTMLHAKTLDIRAQAVERVRGECYTYIVIVFLVAGMGLAPPSITLKALAPTLGAVVTLGLVVVALFYKQYQLRVLPLGGNLRDSLRALIATLDSASRLYMAAYMACIVIGVLAAEGFLLWRYGATLLPLLSLAVAAAFVAWCYSSGRGYLQRMFGDYRAELAERLRELDAA